MLARHAVSALFLALALLPRPAAALSQEMAAQWLSRKLGSPVAAAQMLEWPERSDLEGCAIRRLHTEPSGATALSLRCPGTALPQLALLNLHLDPAGLPPEVALRMHASWRKSSSTAARELPLVRAGATVHAEWRSGGLRAQLPVVALESGAAGAEIRVLNRHGCRVLRARIVNASEVLILAAGA